MRNASSFRVTISFALVLITPKKSYPGNARVSTIRSWAKCSSCGISPSPIRFYDLPPPLPFRPPSPSPLEVDLVMANSSHSVCHLCTSTLSRLSGTHPDTSNIPTSSFGGPVEKTKATNSDKTAQCGEKSYHIVKPVVKAKDVLTIDPSSHSDRLP